MYLKFIYSGTCLFEIITLNEFLRAKENDKSLVINLKVHLFEAHPDSLKVLKNLSPFCYSHYLNLT
jgi:hypothetical protein